MEVTMSRHHLLAVSDACAVAIAVALATGLVAIAPLPAAAQAAASKSKWSTVLREAEHKTVQHPTKNFFANIWPGGLQVSFTNSFGNFATYEFPSASFPADETVHLGSPGSPDLLPLRVGRIAANDYRLEWLPDPPPPAAAGVRVVRSH
jgi:hypothetical protein